MKCHGAVEETGRDFQERARQQEAAQGAERAAEAGQNGYAQLHAPQSVTQRFIVLTSNYLQMVQCQKAPRCL